MRICVDARYLGAEYSGIGVYTANILEKLAQVDHENEYVVVVHSSFRGDLELADNFEVVADDARPVSLRTLFGIHRVAAAHGAEVIHSMHPLGPLLWRGRQVLMLYDLQPLLDPDFTGRRNRLSRRAYDLFYGWSYPACMKKADYIVSTSHATREYLRALFPELAGKVLVVHGGVPPESMRVPGAEEIARVRDKYDLPSRYLFYIGSTRPNKNLQVMVDAFEQFIRSHPEQDGLHLVMILSQDRFFEPVFASIRRRNLLGRIHIHQQVTEQEKVVFYNQAELLYFVTKFEGFGLPVLEAQAQGLPVLASTHSALPEIAGASALLADADDIDDITGKLETFYAGPTLRERMVVSGRENIKRFTWDRVAREILNLYTHLLPKSS